MPTDIVPFTFEEVTVRVEVIDGEPWFVVADLARILGYRDATDAARLLRENHKGYAEVRTPGGAQRMLITSEKGLYRLILRSNASRAEAVQDWVTDEVLPEIHKTGTYTQPGTDAALPQTYLEALEALVVRERANLALAEENAHLSPRATAWDAIASAEGDYSVGDAAKILARAGVPNMGPTRLFRRLEELRWIYRTSGGWRAFADRVERGHLGHKPQFHYHPGTGERVIDAPQVRVTVKGIELLRQRLGGGHPALRAVSA